MPASIPGTPAESTTTSLSNRGGSLCPLSEPDVAPACSTLTDRPSWQTSEEVTILMAMLAGITALTTSSDVLYLAMHDALAICARHGLPPERVAPVLQQFLAESKKLRQHNPFAF